MNHHVSGVENRIFDFYCRNTNEALCFIFCIFYCIHFIKCSIDMFDKFISVIEMNLSKINEK